MSVRIDFHDCRNGDITSAATADVQSLPFQVEFNGNADIANEFTATTKSVEDEGKKALVNYFRGRPTMGSVAKIPKSYIGILLTDSELKNPSSEPQGSFSSPEEKEINSKTLNLISNFESFTYWNWDQIPSDMDCSKRLMDSLEMSNALYETIDPDDKNGKVEI